MNEDSRLGKGVESTQSSGLTKTVGIQPVSQSTPTAIGIAAFAAPVCGSFFLLNPTWSILPGVYAKYFNLELTVIAAVVLYSRLFDSITDPLIGYLSDRHRAAGGSRKLWVIFGALYMLVSAYFLFTPPLQVSWFYYLFWSFNFYLAWTVMDIPHVAWGRELFADYHGRARVYSYRTLFIYVGQTLFFSLPFLPLFSSSEYTPETLRYAVFIGLFLMIPGLLLAKFIAPDGHAMRATTQDSWRDIARSVVRNKPLLLFLGTYFIASTSFGMWAGLVFVYLDGYLMFGNKIAMIFLLGNVAGMLSIPVWLKLIHKTSKSSVWAMGMTLFVICLAGFWFIKPEVTWLLPMLFTSGAYMGFACFNILEASIVADISDYGTIKFGNERGATYFSFLTLINKISLGIGSAISLGVAGYYGFDAVKPDAQADVAIFGLRLGFITLPVICGIIAIALMTMTPINRYRHKIIRRRIERGYVN